MMGDEEIDRTEQISYRKIVSTNTILINSKIAYYKRSVHMYSIIILHALQFGVHSEQWTCIRNKYYFYSKQNMIFLN